MGPPAQFSPDELAEFVDLVTAGGEVTRDGLLRHVGDAQCLGFMRLENVLVGVAGLKTPRDSYRDRIQQSASVALTNAAFPYELGWIFIAPNARGKNLSYPLCAAVVAGAGAAGVIATSRADNEGMHRTLFRLGFVQQGASWPSRQSDGALSLFIKPAN